MPWGRHLCLFYETKQDLLDTLVPYFKAGLESNEFCVWVGHQDRLLTMEEARAALGRAIPKFAGTMCRRDRIELVSPR